MIKELKYINIEYNDIDKEYINSDWDYLEKVSEEIVDYFDINDIKTIVKVIPNIIEFERIYKSFNYSLINDRIPPWVCGFTRGNIIYVLTYKEYIKTKGHELCTKKDYIHLILHEFVHCCHSLINYKHTKWLSEGLATLLSHQYDNRTLNLEVSLENVLLDKLNHLNCYTMFYYVYTHCDKNYINKLINDYDYQKNETKKIYEKTTKYLRSVNN